MSPMEHYWREWRWGRTGFLACAGVVAFVVVVPIVAYLALGRPETIGAGPAEPQAAAGPQGQSGGGENAPHPITPEQVQTMIDQLAKRLQQTPQDGDGWSMLARSYSYLGKFPEAVKAYEKAVQLLPNP